MYNNANSHLEVLSLVSWLYVMCYILECDFFVAECCGQQRIQKIKETHSSFKEFGK